jgi:hypothetical protein
MLPFSIPLCYRPTRGGTGTHARSLRPTLRRTSDRTRRDRHSLHRARRRRSDTRASAPKRSTSPSTSICERCQQFRHSKARAPRSITKRSVHLSTSRSFKSINPMGRHLTRSPSVLKISPLWHSRLNSANGALNSLFGRRHLGLCHVQSTEKSKKIPSPSRRVCASLGAGTDGRVEGRVSADRQPLRQSCRSRRIASRQWTTTHK